MNIICEEPFKKSQKQTMSMYTYTQTREHKRHAENMFQTLIGVHSEHVLTVIVELVMQFLFLGAGIGGISFIVSVYVRAVVHFTSVMWAAMRNEPSEASTDS